MMQIKWRNGKRETWTSNPDLMAQQRGIDTTQPVQAWMTQLIEYMTGTRPRKLEVLEVRSV